MEKEWVWRVWELRTSWAGILVYDFAAARAVRGVGIVEGLGRACLRGFAVRGEDFGALT